MLPLMEAARELEALAADTAKDLSVAKAAQRKTGIDNTADMALLHALSPDGIVENYEIHQMRDDGEPPDVAQGVEARPVLEGLAVSWDTPPAGDYVKAADIRLTPAAGAPFTTRAAGKYGHTFLDLDSDKTYDVEVQLIDAFGRVSGWAPVLTAQPKPSALDTINLSELAALDKLQGLLPNENLATLEDANLLGEGVVLAEAIASYQITAENAIFGALAVPAAAIAELTVDKLEGGILSATDIFIASVLELAAGGVLKTANDGTTIDDGGMTLTVGANYNTPTLNRDQQISALGDWASLAFFDDASPNLRGAVVRSDGNVTVKRGMVALHATENGSLGNSTSGRLEVLARTSPNKGRVIVYEDLLVNNEASAVDFILSGSGAKLSDIRTAANGALPRDGSLRMTGRLTLDTDTTPNENHHAAKLSQVNDVNANANDRLMRDGSQRMTGRLQLDTGTNPSDNDDAAKHGDVKTALKDAADAKTAAGKAVTQKQGDNRWIRSAQVGQDKDGYLIWTG